jgi:hypothetical protein
MKEKGINYKKSKTVLKNTVFPENGRSVPRDYDIKKSKRKGGNQARMASLVHYESI